jgi:hypothetical protein
MGWILDLVLDNIRRKKIRQHNVNSRGIVSYKPSEIGGFIDQDSYNDFTIASGGTAEIRSEVINTLCISALNGGIPVIVLHQGDKVAETYLRNYFINANGFKKCYIVNSSNPVFDPIHGLSNTQIRNLLVNSAPQKYKITSDGGAYISALTLTLSTKFKSIPLTAINAMTNSNQLANLIASGAVPQSVSNSVQTYYAQGQNEVNGVNSYIYDLWNECSSFLPRNMAQYNNDVTLNAVFQNGGILMLDVVSDVNTLSIRLLLELLNEYVRVGKQFLLIIDNLVITEENGLKRFFGSNNRRIGKSIVSDDLFSLCGGDKTLFNAFLGKSQKWFIFNHMSNESATLWSKGIGEYSKIETTINVGTGYGKGTGFGTRNIGWNRNTQYQSGETYHIKDEEKVKPYEIQKLGSRQGLVYSGKINELAYIDKFLI